MAPHPTRDGGRGGKGGKGDWNWNPVWKPPVKVPPPRPNLGPKLAHELAQQNTGGLPAHLPVGFEAMPPSTVGTDAALLRVWRELPVLQKHAPLGAIVATNAPLPDASQGAEALRQACATELARCRRAFLEGAPLPRAVALGGALFPESAVHTALLVDATAGVDGVLGDESTVSDPNAENSSAFAAADDGFARRRGPAPPASALDASAMSPAYSRMFRSGAVADAFVRALSLPPEDLCVPALCNGVRISTSAETPRGGAGGNPVGPVAADFGIRRCVDASSSSSSREGPERTSLSSSAFGSVAGVEWPVGEFVTRHVTAINVGMAPVLIVAIVCVPEMRAAFRVRCDHRELVRHSGDLDPPGSGLPSHDSEAGEDGPVVLFPGASYEISVDFRAEGRRNAPGHVAQWVLFATVECPAGWKTGDGFPARRARARDDADDADDADVDPRDVRVAGCRAVAVVLRGSRERRLEVASMMLNPETPKFVPKRLREAFDELPRALVSPPAYLLGFVGEPDAAEQQTPHGVSRFMRIHPSVVASVCTPAAYLGPDGVLVPRAFFRVTQDGAREGAVTFEDAAQWRFASQAVTRWARLLAVEERRQALDIRRYDLHDAVFVFAGRTPRALPGQHYDTYALDVPGLLEGYPPVAPLDVLKLRITKAGGGRDETTIGLNFTNTAVSGGVRRESRFDKSNFDFHVEDERCVVRRGGRRGKRLGGWEGSYGVVDEQMYSANRIQGRNMNEVALDDGVPLDTSAEVCATVFRVVARKGLVLVAFPPCVSRTMKGDPRVAIRAHVRFAHDVNAFKVQRAALLAAQANPATLAMLREEVPEYAKSSASSTDLTLSGSREEVVRRVSFENARRLFRAIDASSSFEKTGSDELVTRGSAELFPYSRRVVKELRARLNDEQWRVVRDVSLGVAAVAGENSAPLGPPYCAFGPPGTGKTVTVVAAIVSVLATQADARVLVCAPAPFAADVVCSRLADLTKELRAAAVADGDDAPPPALEPVSLTSLPSPNSNELQASWTMVRVNDPRRDPASVKSDVVRFCASGGSESAAARNARVVVASCASAGLLAEAFATANGGREFPQTKSDFNANEQKGASSFAFTHVLVDEAGQATVPETLVPLRMTSGKTTRAVVLAGDPKQLGPVVHASSASALRDSLLASAVRAHEAEEKKRASSSSSSSSAGDARRSLRRLVKLVRNYRSHEDIFGLSSRLFYENALVAAAPEDNVSLPKSLVGDVGAENGTSEKKATNEAEAENEDENENKNGRPARVLFVGVRGVQTREGTGEAPSFFNAMEARTLVDLLSTWLGDEQISGKDRNENEEKGDALAATGDSPATYADASADGTLRLRTCDVGVIAPYRAQVVRLRMLLRARGLGAVRVGTVDDYQGQEEKVMFISTVASRAPPTLRRRQNLSEKNGSSSDDAASSLELDVGDPRSGFLACPLRFNVAVTRAKALNVIVGHPAALERWAHWKALLSHCVARGAYVGEGALAADLGLRHDSPRLTLPRVYHDGGGTKYTNEEEKTKNAKEEEEFEALASAVARVAETSLLGGGDADEMFPDFEVGTSFGDHQSWRVAL